ncbi:sensor histidine kinase [Ligilactobacillus agilis]|uniref:Sensor histidine kinase NatK-like C-terminal domain-containing protein n=2 Tax=Ligilactobacillus agilis TaxID=1601 RepID=A0A6F9Y418_9LACO|nr:GHKL domain-containing protein [Ligilactobacillus agilis]GET12222.1 hypothetical protein SN811_07220 [Ligilactobacillus agilis]
MGNYVLGMISTLLIAIITVTYASKIKFDLAHILCFTLLMLGCIPIKISNLIMIFGGVLITHHQDQGKNQWLRYTLFVMYAFVTTWILQVILNFYGSQFASWINYNNYLGTFVCQSVVLLIQLGVIYLFRDSLEILALSPSNKKKGAEVVAIIILAVYLVYGSTFDNDYNNWWISIYVVGLILFWSYVRALALLETKRELAELRNFELKNLENYANDMEEAYQKLRRFRHDYLNILLSLDQAIKSGNLGLIRQTYDKVLAPSKAKINMDYYDFGKLNHIKTSAIKSILYNKFSYATHEGIKLEIEIIDDVKIQRTKLLDAVRIISILLDNAIEAALESNTPKLLVAYIKDANTERVIIENSIALERVELAPIFKEGYTSKSGDRGQGLATVKRLISHYPNVVLNTSSHDYKFTQELILSKEE